jgi:anti-sigma regulatory factor (Ser/Thr protein kinase)
MRSRRTGGPNTGEVIREMHRTGTGPFPARPFGSGGYRPPPADPPAAGTVPSAPGPGWALRSQLELGPLPGAVPCARLHARLVLWEWGQSGLADTVELIVSELVTNALRAAAPGYSGYPPDSRPQPIGLRLGSDREQVLVEVWDPSPEPPVTGLATDDGETGRGLLMVQTVSRRWGYYFPAAGTFGAAAVKVVWALVGPGAPG